MKRKQIISLIMAAGLTVSLFTGCGNSKSADTSSADTTAAAASSTAAAEEAAGEFKDHMDISIAWWNVGDDFGPQDEILKSVEKKFNITFKPVQITWNDYKDKFLIWASSGQTPDIYSDDNINKDLYFKWIEQGIVRNLPDDMSKYQNLNKILQDESIQKLKVDGKFYMFPRMNVSDPTLSNTPKMVIYARKDWMEKLGKAEPKNLDEFIALMKAFRDNDPDGNGKNDTIGLACNKRLIDDTLTMTLVQKGGADADKRWVKQGDQWAPLYTTEQINELLQINRRLYTEGAIDRDFALVKDQEPQEKFASGKAGAVVSFLQSGGDVKTLDDQYKKYNPGKDVTDVLTVLHPWPAADGKIYRDAPVTAGSNFWSESYFGAQVDDKKMERIMALYDWLLTDEASELLTAGVENKDFKKADGKITEVLREKPIRQTYPSVEVLAQLATWGGDRNLVNNVVNQHDFGKKNVEFWAAENQWWKDNSIKYDNPIQNEMTYITTPAFSKLQQIDIIEEIAKITLSKDDPVKMWKDTVKSFDGKGLQDAIKEVNEKLKAEGK